MSWAAAHMAGALVPDDAGTLVQALAARTERRGLSWRMRPGVVTLSTLAGATRALLDADGVDRPVVSLIGVVPVGSRVMCMLVPPNACYMVGWAAAALAPGTLVAHFSSDTNQTANNNTAIYINWNYPIENPYGMTPGLSIVPPFPGLYRIEVRVGWNAAGAGGNCYIRVQKNFDSGPTTVAPDGTDFVRAPKHDATAGTFACHATSLMRFNGGTDYFRTSANQVTGTNTTTRRATEAAGIPDAASTLTVTYLRP